MDIIQDIKEHLVDNPEDIGEIVEDLIIYAYISYLRQRALILVDNEEFSSAEDLDSFLETFLKPKELYNEFLEEFHIDPIAYSIDFSTEHYWAVEYAKETYEEREGYKNEG